MGYAVSRGGWLMTSQPGTGYIAYISTHITKTYLGVTQPKWMIVKEKEGYMLYTFMYGGYHRLTGFQHHKLLKDVKYYCDVEVERFHKGQY